MAPSRKVDTNDILDAAERVVTRLGAVGLSLDNVAKEAGISKTRVVYDYKNKNALVEAIVERQLKAEQDSIAAFVKENAKSPHPEFYGRLNRVEKEPDDLDRALATIITASMADKNAIHARMQEWVEDDLKAMQKGDKPRAALVAYMTLIGFFSHEWLGLKDWTKQERQQILKDIEDVYKSFPDNN